MQDNAFIYQVYKVRDWFINNNIIQLEYWPPYSLDLNPIEHIW